jgi:hypothetical protein
LGRFIGHAQSFFDMMESQRRKTEMEEQKIVDLDFYRTAKCAYQKLEGGNQNLGLDFDNYLKLREFLAMLSKKKSRTEDE